MARKEIAEYEYQNQKRILDSLPADFEYPLFNGWQAIQSQRKSGYQTTARAAREIVDNSIEAGAENVHIVFDTIGEADRKEFQRKNTVSAIAFIDDGPGMLHESNERSILRYSMSWGGGTRFDNPRLIGKFGFGLPNSSVNQTQFAEVYSRTDPSSEWNVAALDIRREAIDNSGVVRAGEVQQKPLPRFVVDYLNRRKIDLRTGTVVVWWQPDRLSASTRTALREHIEHDFQVVYRGLLDRVQLFVDRDEPVFKVDPTFLDPDGYLYVAEHNGGAQSLYDEHLTVLHYRDASSGQPQLLLVGPEKGRDPLTGMDFEISLEEAKRLEQTPGLGQRDVGISSIHVRVSYLPYPDFVRKEGKKVETDAGRRFQIRKRTRGMSFVRSGREIDTKDVFPKTNREEIGNWPLLQGYAYYWTLEVAFDSGIDDVMGIGHDKQTVYPVEDYWKVLHKARVDDAITRGEALRDLAGKANRAKAQDAADVDFVSEQAAEQATKFDPPIVPGSTKTKAQAKEAAEQADVGSTSTDVPRPKAGKRRPASEVLGGEAQPTKASPDTDETSEVSRPVRRFMIDKFSDQNGPFMEPVPGPNGQVIVRVNTAHPWYGSYANPSSLTEARNATNLLLFALGATEVRADEEKQIWLEAVRREDMTPFLRKAGRFLRQMVPADDQQEMG